MGKGAHLCVKHWVNAYDLADTIQFKIDVINYMISANKMKKINHIH